MTMRVLQIGALWVVVATAGFWLLRVIDEALTVPGAHAGADVLLALFTSLPIAILTATAIAIHRQASRSDRPPWLAGRRAIGLAVTALLVEGILIGLLELHPTALLQWGVFAAWVGVMLGAGGRLAELFAGLR